MSTRFVSIALVGILLISASSFMMGQARLHVVGGTRVDFGEMYATSEKRLVPLVNIGTDTLVISNVGSSCHCTGTLFSNDHIAPGDTGYLSVSFDTRSYAGLVEKSISMTTSDTSQKHVSLIVIGTVVKTLEFDPEYFYFSTRVDSLTTKTLGVKNSSKETIKILSIKPASNLIHVTAESMELKPEEETTLTAVIRPTTAGTLNGDIEIITDHPRNALFTMRYFALVKAAKSTPTLK